MSATPSIAKATNAEHQMNTRWWENYLVRYFLGAIFGALCVVAILWSIFRDALWLGPHVDALTNALYKGGIVELPVTSGIALLLAGVFFCYVASTPITVFHAARLITIKFKLRAAHAWLSWPVILVVASLISIWTGSYWSMLLALAWPAAYSALGQYAAVAVLLEDSDKEKPDGVTEGSKTKGAEPSRFNYLNAAYLARCVMVEKRATNEVPVDKSEFIDSYRRLAIARSATKKSAFIRDFRDSYSHLREHANSVFILLYEISLAAFIVGLNFCIGTSIGRMVCTITILCLWLVPNVVLWGRANKLEASLIPKAPSGRGQL